MATEYVMPKLAMAMNQGIVSQWLIEDGQYVEKDQEILTVETEKVTYDLESPNTGYFKIVVPNGETVPVETCIGYFVESEAEISELTEKLAQQETSPASEPAREAVPVVEASPEAAPQPVIMPQQTAVVAVPAASTISSAPVINQGRIKASPLAKKIATDNNLDLSRVTGTGPGGRIVKRDVNKALDQGVNLVPVAAAIGAMVEKARVPLSGLRATIAERMMSSQQNTASLASSWESDITRLLDVRKQFVERAEKLGTKVSVNALLIKAMVYAIKQVPITNSAQQGNDIIVYENINVGIAMAMPGATEFESGLMVPVLKGVDRMGLVEIDIALKALIERARNGMLSGDDLSDSTITLSSTLGISPPGLTTAPILNTPNTVIVGPSTPKDKPVVVDGEIKIRTVMPMSMTFDHRLMDGEPAARFMNALHECLESPELMLA